LTVTVKVGSSSSSGIGSGMRVCHRSSNGSACRGLWITSAELTTTAARSGNVSTGARSVVLCQLHVVDGRAHTQSRPPAAGLQTGAV